MGYTYAVLGAGRQGIAAAYDMARNGDAAAVLLADMDLAVAKAGAERINRLPDSNCVRAARVDVSDEAELIAFLAGVDAALSAVPYRFNMVISLHDLNLAALYADQLALLGEGRLQAAGLPVEVLTWDRLSQVYGVLVAVTHHPLYGTPLVVPAIGREVEPDGP